MDNVSEATVIEANTEFYNVERFYWINGIEVNHNGNSMDVASPWAVGAVEREPEPGLGI